MPDVRLANAAFTILPNRGVLRLSGPDWVAFLQGLVSNDVASVGETHAIYACLLTPQGKFLHDLFLVADGDSLLIECEADRREDLIRRLNSYKLRSKIGISDVTGEFLAVAVFGESAASMLLSGGGAGDARQFGGGIAYDDPRLPALGVRLLLPTPSGLAPLEAAGIVNAPYQDYERLRIAEAVPDGSRDMEVEGATLLECNIDWLNGISWDKGCYTGQELTSRTRYRGLVKKRLVPVRISGEPPPSGSVLHLDGREAGEMRSHAGDLGLALLRLDALRSGRSMVVGETRLTPQIPPRLAAILSET